MRTNVLYIIAMGLFSFFLGGCGSNESVRTIGPEPFKQELGSVGVQLLDVRTPSEFAEGHIAGAANVNVLENNFVERVGAKLDKSQPIYLYCRSGQRSMKAAKMLSREGYEVVNLNGGIMGWMGAGYPVVAD